MPNIFYVVGVMIFFVGLGNTLGGYAEDIVWESGGKTLPKCDEIEAEELREHCFTINETYYNTKFQYQALGTITPLIFGIIAIWRMI